MLYVNPTRTNFDASAFSAHGLSLELNADEPQTAGIVVQPIQAFADRVFWGDEKRDHSQGRPYYRGEKRDAS